MPLEHRQLDDFLRHIHAGRCARVLAERNDFSVVSRACGVRQITRCRVPVCFSCNCSGVISSMLKESNTRAKRALSTVRAAGCSILPCCATSLPFCTPAPP